MKKFALGFLSGAITTIVVLALKESFDDDFYDFLEEDDDIEDEDGIFSEASENAAEDINVDSEE